MKFGEITGFALSSLCFQVLYIGISYMKRLGLLLVSVIVYTVFVMRSQAKLHSITSICQRINDITLIHEK